MLYDCIVVGTGPAGVSAALNLKIRQKEFLLLGDPALSGKIAKAERVDNYPGLPGISGSRLREALASHLASAGIEPRDLMVNEIRKYGDTFAVSAGSEFFECRTVILATGAVFTGTLEGEEEFVGRGVSYCATCDGGLYRGRHIAAVCGSARFEPEIRYLAGLAASVEFYPAYRQTGEMPDNVTVRRCRVNGIRGGKRVEALLTSEGEMPVDGIFLLREAVSLSTLLPGLETEDGRIVTDRSMATSVPGVFACGDCTGRPYQYAKAVGEGNIAAHSAVEALD